MLELIENFCEVCGAPLTEDGICECSGEDYAFSKSRSFAVYDEIAKTLIHDLKFRKRPEYGEKIIDYLISNHADLSFAADADIIIPVPLHKKRERKRGYNQTAVLGAELGRKLQKPCFEKALKKIKDTLPQSDLSGEERRKNISGAYSVRDKDAVNGKIILLIDDVFTTGSTLNECAQTLLNAGAHKIYCFTVAKTVKAKTVKVKTVKQL